jgi:hypothetical protein
MMLIHLKGLAGGDKYICEGILFKFANGSFSADTQDGSGTPKSLKESAARDKKTAANKLYGGK